MTMTRMDNKQAAENIVELNELLDTYMHCLNISRDYVDATLYGDEFGDIDVDKLTEFLQARSELFDSAEKSLRGLQFTADENFDPNREQKRQRVIGILEEMAAMEEQLAGFLNDKLKEMRNVIANMGKTHTVFKHYSELGGKIGPKLFKAQG